MTRLFIAKLAARALNLQPDGSARFADTSDPTSARSITPASSRGSYAGNQLVYLPGDNISRAEISAVIWRIYNLD